MGSTLAELRLLFHVMPDVKGFHEPYLAVNRDIAELLVTGELGRAEDRLIDYFDEAEEQLVAAFATLDTSDGG